MEEANRDQIAFYLERARQSGRPALELGCGSGVIAVALALAGVDVVAIEPSDDLANQAVERRRALGLAAERCRIERADLRSIRLGRQFGFVYCPGALVSLGGVDDLAAVFATARTHLASDASFAFDLRQQPGPVPDGRLSRTGLELREADARRPHLVRRAGPARRANVHRLVLLRLTADEIQDSLAASGLVPLELWGGFDERPFGPESDRLVVVAGRQA